MAAVVETSKRVTETTKRLEKIDLLARLLHELHPEEIEIVVPFLAGSIRQGRIGIGYAALRDAQGPAAATASLEIAEVDRTFQSVIAASGSGSQRRRSELLQQMFLRATEPEQQFLVRLLIATVAATAAAWALGRLLPGRGDDVTHLMAGVRVVLVVALDVGIFVVLARAMRLREVTTVLDTVVHRFTGARDS